MNRKKLLAAVCLAALATIGLPADKVSAQSGDKEDDSVEAVAEDKDSGKAPNKQDGSIGMVTRDEKGREKRRLSYDGIMEPVGLAAGQGITITLEASSNKAGQPVRIAPLDGGEIIAPPALSVANDGTVGFRFQSGQTAGLYRVLVILGAQQYELHLYAVRPVASH